jgi:hypothetical protein
LTRGATDERRVVWSTAAGVVAGGAVFAAILLDLGTDLARTAVSLGYASNFFDFQARSLMDGHLWVPPDSLGIEGFVRGGHTYMYFPPFPALVRLPVMLVTHEFDGRLTLASMALAWVVFTVMAVKLFWLVRRCVRGTSPVTRFEAVLAGCFLAAALGGTVLTFDASLPWAYHEVYLWAVALVVGALYWLLRAGLDPQPKTIAWLAAFTLAAMMTRVTGGWAMAVSVLLLAAWTATGRPHREARQRWRLLVLAGAVPLAAGIAYNYVKFHHPYLFPLEDQVWTQLNAHRREALRVNGGTITGPQFFTTSLVNYFRPGGIRFVDYFPWITLPGHPARAYGGAFIDQSYRTGSVTAFMPLFLLLTVGALPVLFRPGVDLGHRVLRLVLLAGVLVTGGVMGYGYLAYRYTSEFVPGILLGGCVGFWALTGLVDRTAGRLRVLRWPAFAAVTALAAFGILANAAAGFATAAETSRGPALDRYLSLQADLSSGPGSSFARLVSQSDSLPSGSRTDGIHIRGDCDGLYLNTGDAYEPWVAVEERDQVVEVSATRARRADRMLLFRVHGSRDREVWLQTNRDRQARVYLRNEHGSYVGQWFDIPPDAPVRVGVRNDTDLGHVEVGSTPGGFVGFLPVLDIDRSWDTRPGTVRSVVRGRTTTEDGHLTARPLHGLDLPLCRRLARAAGLRLGARH